MNVMIFIQIFITKTRFNQLYCFVFRLLFEKRDFLRKELKEMNVRFQVSDHQIGAHAMCFACVQELVLTAPIISEIFYGLVDVSGIWNTIMKYLFYRNIDKNAMPIMRTNDFDWIPNRCFGFSNFIAEYRTSTINHKTDAFFQKWNQQARQIFTQMCWCHFFESIIFQLQSVNKCIAHTIQSSNWSTTYKLTNEIWNELLLFADFKIFQFDSPITRSTLFLSNFETNSAQLRFPSGSQVLYFGA